MLNKYLELIITLVLTLGIGAILFKIVNSFIGY